MQFQKPKPTTLSPRYPRWKPESPQAAEKTDHQHTNPGTPIKPETKKSKMCLPASRKIKTMEQMIRLTTIFSIYISACTRIATFLIGYNIGLT